MRRREIRLCVIYSGVGILWCEKYQIAPEEQVIGVLKVIAAENVI